MVRCNFHSFRPQDLTRPARTCHTSCDHSPPGSDDAPRYALPLCGCHSSRYPILSCMSKQSSGRHVVVLKSTVREIPENSIRPEPLLPRPVPLFGFLGTRFFFPESHHTHHARVHPVIPGDRVPPPFPNALEAGPLTCSPPSPLLHSHRFHLIRTITKTTTARRRSGAFVTRGAVGRFRRSIRVPHAAPRAFRVRHPSRVLPAAANRNAVGAGAHSAKAPGRGRAKPKQARRKAERH